MNIGLVPTLIKCGGKVKNSSFNFWIFPDNFGRGGGVAEPKKSKKNIFCA
jgi:hypothetical protein